VITSSLCLFVGTEYSITLSGVRRPWVSSSTIITGASPHPEASDGLKGLPEIFGGAVLLDLEHLLDLVEDGQAASDMACRTPANTDNVPSPGVEMELGIEGGHPKSSEGGIFISREITINASSGR
jgi:hypothetical protein